MTEKQIYRYHLFFCTHQRDDGTACCQDHNAQALRDYAKQRVKDLKLKKVRVNNAGCLNRCALGPIMVVYPEGVWYRAETQQDIDEIIDSHLQQGVIVDRLKK
jgi:(2Fe-2S) ferredoxin